MVDSVNNGIPFVPENTIDPAAGLNLSLNTIDALLQVLVQTVGANTPPGSPVNGARYIVGTAPTGAWAGQANKLARYLDSAWQFFNARYALNAADGSLYVRSASTWVVVSGGGGGGSGDVVGPSSAANNGVALFDGITGKLIKDGGVLGSAAFRAALGSAGSLYSRDSILGTVSQTAGVPTGAIIERGSNANGEYVKFADGTMICSRKITFVGPINTLFGAVYNGAVVAASNYPATFAAIPATAMLVESITDGDPWLVGSNSRPVTTTQWGGFYVLNPISIGSSVTAIIGLSATGRWF